MTAVGRLPLGRGEAITGPGARDVLQLPGPPGACRGAPENGTHGRLPRAGGTWAVVNGDPPLHGLPQAAPAKSR
ncbi:hypothetical protein ACWDZX_37790, partial [Streptomyces collinus]